MKKTLLAASLATAMGAATTTEAAFTAMGDGDYQMVITGGCFDFGNCQSSGNGALADNTIAEQATIFGFGSGIVGDGVMGVIDFTLSDGNLAVTSFSQDSYLNTAGGTFYLQDQDELGLSMTGTIDGAGNMSFDPDGRDGIAAAFATTLGLQEWNRDNTLDGAGTDNYDVFTTASDTNRLNGLSAAFTVTGSVLQDSIVNERTGTLVSTGNIGQNWGDFNNTQYTEVWDVTISLIAGLPKAVDDVFVIKPATTLNININTDLILPNDTHSDATETISFVMFDDSLTDAASSVTETGGVITYVPNPAFLSPSTDSFTYIITDGAGKQSTATVTITITNAEPPVANADDVATPEDTPLTLDPVHATLSVTGVVLDSDPIAAEIPNLTITAVDAFSANNGTITLAPGSNEVTYTPAANFIGVDTFNYTIQNSVLLSDSTTVTVNVAAVNDAPVCVDVSLITPINTLLDIDVANDLLSTTSIPPLCVDEEGNAVTLNSIDGTGSEGGSMAFDGANSLTYTPMPDFNGPETFSYTATDGMNLALPNTLTINVADPTASNFTMLEKSGNVFGGTNDVDIVWDEVSYNAITVDANGVPTDTNFSLITVASPFPFFGFTWSAHNVRIFKNTTAAPITLNFDVTCRRSDYDSGVVDCNRPLSEQDALRQYITLILQPGEIGGHILFDWNNAKDIDVVTLWKENAAWDTFGDTAPKNQLWQGSAGVPPDPATDWRLVSTDVPGDGSDGINGSPMIDGAFIGFYANFNYKPASAGEGLPPYTGEIEDVEVSAISLWVLLTGLFSIFGLRKFKN